MNRNINKTKLLHQFILATLLASQIANLSAKDMVEVNHIGELRQIATSQLNEKVPFKSLLQDKALYGLGMQTGLDAEVLVLANKAYVGGFRKMAYQYPLTDNPNISFLVYSYVDKWQSATLPDEVDSCSISADITTPIFSRISSSITRLLLVVAILLLL